MEVKLQTNRGKAIVEGKTAIPFKTIVKLILQRKIMHLCKDSGDEAVILDSDLLTNIASAPQDSQESKSQLVLVTLGTGVLVGIFSMAIVEFLLAASGILLGSMEYLAIAGSLLALCVVAYVLQRIKQRGKSDKLTENMEKLATLLSK